MHKKETSLSPECLDDIYNDNDDDIGTLLLFAVVYKLVGG